MYAGESYLTSFKGDDLRDLTGWCHHFALGEKAYDYFTEKSALEASAAHRLPFFDTSTVTSAQTFATTSVESFDYDGDASLTMSLAIDDDDDWGEFLEHGEFAVAANAFLSGEPKAPRSSSKGGRGRGSKNIKWGPVIARVERSDHKTDEDCYKKAMSLKNYPGETTDHKHLRDRVNGCSRHHECPHQTKLELDKATGDYSLYCFEQHTNGESLLAPRRGSAISAAVTKIIDPLIAVGAAPSKVTRALVQQLVPASLIPDSASLRNYKHRKLNADVADIQTDDDLLRALAPFDMADADPANLLADGTLLVARIWNSGTLLASQTDVAGATAHGLAYTSPGCIRSLRQLQHLQRTGQLPYLYGHLDFTFKNLHNDWITGVFGVSMYMKGGGAEDYSATGAPRRYVADSPLTNTLVPLVLCNAKTENTPNTFQFLTAIEDIQEKFCRGQTRLQFDGVMMDLSGALRKSVTDLFPTVDILACYFHMMENVKKNKGKQVNKAHFSKIQEDIRRMHLCRSTGQFDLMCKVFLTDWRNAGEGDFADYFDTWHLQSGREKWHILASPARIPATDNPLESFNQVAIKHIVDRKRALLGSWLAADGDLHKILAASDRERTLESKQCAPFLCQRDMLSWNPPHCLSLEKSQRILVTENSYLQFRDDGIDCFVMSSSSTRVTVNLVAKFRTSLQGPAEGAELSYEDLVELDHVHLIRVLPYDRGDPDQAAWEAAPEMLLQRRVRSDGRLIPAVYCKAHPNREYALIVKTSAFNIHVYYRNNDVEEIQLSQV
ncbi:hypothetical protein B484DRAFT_434382 [Ochromonadaceae sp. CCMP2298]|nr:hypothetical protein B484DRAFT_434382 [Ochromonadaceae sp. CCMP2298]